MTAAQPRVASRAAPHGGGPAYLPRLKGAKGGHERSEQSGGGDATGAGLREAYNAKYHDSLRRQEHPTGGRAVCSAAEQGPDRAGVCT